MRLFYFEVVSNHDLHYRQLWIPHLVLDQVILLYVIR